MKSLATLCNIFGRIWLLLATLFICLGLIGVWRERGFSGIQEMLSPFNVVNHASMIITLAPGFGLQMLAKKLNSKAEK